MNRVPSVAFRVTAAAILLFSGVSRSQAQAPTPAPPPPAQADAEEKRDPFAPEPSPVLPPGMTGADVNDPRAKLAAGIYDAGEAAMGMKHLMLAKKPGAFQLGAADAEDAKVQKTLGLLGMNDTSKMPKPMQLVRAQLAFANSDLAFQGTHLFQGNFYGVNNYTHSHSRYSPPLPSTHVPCGP